MARRPRQLALDLRTPARDGTRRGGPRPGAGRKRARPDNRPCVSHVSRPEHEGAHPVHVTLRVKREVGFLRKERVLRVVVDRLRRASPTFRVLHFSVQSDHLHLLVEAANGTALARKMTGLMTWLARKVNHLLGRTGRFFADRYHRRDLRTPSEVRSALVYVLNNRKKHERQRTGSAPAGLDVYSSAAWLEVGWHPAAERARRHARDELERIVGCRASPFAAAETWLARGGWRRAPRGCLSPHEVPGPSM